MTHQQSQPQRGRGRPAFPAAMRRSESVHIRLNDAEMDAICHIARKTGDETFAAVIRRALRELGERIANG